MAHAKFDGVVEAVRYTPDGQVSMVRMYERRGPIFSDRVIVNREELIRRIRSGQVIVAGERKELMAGTFRVELPILAAGTRGQEKLVTGSNHNPPKDDLQGVPLF